MAYSNSRQSNESTGLKPSMALKSNTITSNNSLNDFEQVTSSYYSTENNEEKIGPNSFSILALIGKGSFGEVYLVEKVQSRLTFAMKVLHKQKIISKIFLFLDDFCMKCHKIIKYIYIFNYTILLP